MIYDVIFKEGIPVSMSKIGNAEDFARKIAEENFAPCPCMGEMYIPQLEIGDYEIFTDKDFDVEEEIYNLKGITFGHASQELIDEINEFLDERCTEINEEYIEDIKYSPDYSYA